MARYSPESIDDIFVAVSTSINAQNIKKDFGSGTEESINPLFIRSDQDVTRGSKNPSDIDYPFVSYKIISENTESFRSHIVKNEAGGLENNDPNKPINKNTRNIKKKVVVSISIVSDTESGLDKCYFIGQLITDYFFTTDVPDAVVFIADSTIENRTTDLNGEIEYKIGFDIRVDINDALVKTSEAIREIKIGTTVDTIGDTVEDEIITK